MGLSAGTIVPERRTSMSWWNAKYTNNDGEYEITFASKNYEKAKAVEKVCCAVMDRAVKSPLDVEVVVRCRECKYSHEDEIFGNRWCDSHLGCRKVKDDGYCYLEELKEGVD